VSLLIQACRGLAAAHASEIVHRDLKPANLFLTRRSDGADLVKVLDFGIAKLIDAEGTSITGTGKLLGTACYMPPEQAKGDPDLDHRSDIYALGAILYELLTAQKAHPGTNYNAVLFHILTQRSEPVRSLRPDVPPGVAAVVERAMAFERADRYGSVTALGEALLPFLSAAASTMPRTAGTPPVAAMADTLVSAATVERPTPPAPAPPRRGRAGVWVAVALAVAVLAAGARVLTQRLQPAPAPHPVEIPRVVQTASPSLAPSPSVALPSPAPLASPAVAAPAVAVAPVESAPKARRKTRSPAARGKKPAAGDDFDTRNPYDE
jgi:serine/threonine-protein kinase